MANSAFFEEHKNQLWFMTLRQFLRHKMAVFGMIIMAVIILMVVFVDQIVPYDPETPDLNNMLSPPSLQHPFGTDELGRDMFTRTMHGGRVSLIVGVFAMLVAVTIGTLIGAIAGYFGGTIDNLFYAEALPNPTFGTGGIFWASLTLALMTVPVVIVSTEEGLSAVPLEYREGSLALGATKFETMFRVILPSALPGILTGLILAISRATGEVAPLMLTGVVKLAPALPVDGHFPFVHLDRKFMHLGFHIYDVGFQSPNVEAAKPMVYVTTLVLVLVVVCLNLTAIAVRNHMRKKLRGAAV